MHESMSFHATSRRDCSIRTFGFGPSRRLSPSVFHGYVDSVSNASAASSERIAVVSVAVARLSHVGMLIDVLPWVAYAAVISSPERVNSSSTNSVYICRGS